MIQGGVFDLRNGRRRAETAKLGVMIDSKLLEILVCPVTRTALVYHADTNELWAKVSGLAYPVRDGIPVMLEDEARELTREEQEGLN